MLRGAAATPYKHPKREEEHAAGRSRHGLRAPQNEKRSMLRGAAATA